MSTYLAITPARDEREFLPRMIESMAAQKVAPRRWILIDDGSADGTGALIDQAARRYSFITPIHLQHDRPRAAGGESVTIRCLPEMAWRKVDYIFRLDADLSFEPDFAQMPMAEFDRDPVLGIASASLFEPAAGGWRERPTPGFHTRGATKVYSRICWATIGGLETGLGWDTIDEVRAMMAGFKTRSFRHIRANHHRPQGSASGGRSGHYNMGQTAHYVGYAPVFFAARAARMLIREPLAAAWMTAGFVGGYIHRKPRVPDHELIRFVRHQQYRRLLMLHSFWR